MPDEYYAADSFSTFHLAQLLALPKYSYGFNNRNIYQSLGLSIFAHVIGCDNHGA